jgi:lipid A 3-O-deacylase
MLNFCNTMRLHSTALRFDALVPRRSLVVWSGESSAGWGMAASGARSGTGKKHRVSGWPSLALVAAAALLAPAGARAQNLSYNEVKFGVLAHDVHFLGGKEGGVDLNPEVIFQSPVSDAWAAGVPWYLRWMVQPRPTIGGEFNTSGFTNQYYFGATWTWQLASNVVMPGDGVTFGYFFGPSFNDGDIIGKAPNKKSLGANVLFREAFELGYRITPVYQVSGFLDHVSNGGLAKQNQSINDVGVRFGFRF